MKQCKHPMVKKLRKAGYSLHAAMTITKLALSYRHGYGSWYGVGIDGWFTWEDTPEGHDYWSYINYLTE